MKFQEEKTTYEVQEENIRNRAHLCWTAGQVGKEMLAKTPSVVRTISSISRAPHTPFSWFQQQPTTRCFELRCARHAWGRRGFDRNVVGGLDCDLNLAHANRPRENGATAAPFSALSFFFFFLSFESSTCSVSLVGMQELIFILIRRTKCRN